MVWLLVFIFLIVVCISIYKEIQKDRKKKLEFDSYTPKPKIPETFRNQPIHVEVKQHTPSKIVDSKFFFVWGRSYDFEVVGESNYQDSLGKIAGKKEDTSKFVEECACLKREPNNRFDPNAVTVKIQGLTVAYLSKSEAKTFSRSLKNIGIDEYSSIYVRAVIVGGWNKGSSVGNFGVKLDMPDYSKLKNCMSSISFDDADEKLKKIPLSSQQKQQLKLLNLKPSEDINYFGFMEYINHQISEIKKDNPDLYSKWVGYSEEQRLKSEIYEFWSDKDELDVFDIKKPSKSLLNRVIDELIQQGKSLDDVVDDPELVYELLIEMNPDLER